MSKSVTFLAYSGSVGANTFTSVFDISGYNKISVLANDTTLNAAGTIIPQVSLATQDGVAKAGSFINLNTITYPDPHTAGNTWTGAYLADPNSNHPQVQRLQSQPICGKWGRINIKETGVVSSQMEIWVCLSE